MQFSRLTLAVTLSSALLVTACTGADDPDEGATSVPTTSADDAAETSGDAGSATTDAAVVTDDAAVTDDASSTTVAMTTDEGEAVLSVDEAEEVASRVLEDRYAAYTAGNSVIAAAQERAFVGTARTAAQAEVSLRHNLGIKEEQPAERLEDPNVLAISREDGEQPAFLLVQTVPESGVPLLHLLESPDGEADTFSIVWEASMLPGTELPTFDRRSVGTPVLRSGQGELVEMPRDTLKKLAAFISWPQPEEDPGIVTNGYAEAVREAAEEQADAVSAQANLREKNWLVNDDTKTLLFEDGSAFVIGSLLRDTTFSVRSDAILTPPESFLVFSDDGELTDEAVLRTSVFVGMQVPAEGQDVEPTVIAAREQLVDAWGS